ncbi:MAG TPA: OsmC family protein [Thermoanaerobaculia bacterium]|nr:OsmC family protein [Thermoanaerobaculia bacterium]
MQQFPHRYSASATAGETGEVTLGAPGLPPLASAPPAEFDGPGDQWSPETLLIAAVADCLVLTFRAIARASQLPWTHLDCEVDGTLDRVERVTRFTELQVRARLRVPAGTSEERALRLLQKAEETCLVTRSLTATSHLEASVEVADAG